MYIRISEDEELEFFSSGMLGVAVLSTAADEIIGRMLERFIFTFCEFSATLALLEEFCNNHQQNVVLLKKVKSYHEWKVFCHNLQQYIQHFHNYTI
jgi:hypothetical protein